MKKVKLITIICLVLVLGLATGKILKTRKDYSNSVGLHVTYKSLEDLYENSQVIIKGDLLNSNGEIVQTSEYPVQVRQYDVKVNKVFMNLTDNYIKQGDIITLSYPVKIGDYNLVDNKDLELGSYVLFLNIVHTSNNKYFVPNTPNNLYSSNTKSMNNNSQYNSYININNNGGLKEFTESELEYIINNAKE